MSDIENGRKMAVVELEHELPGVFETVPFDQLTVAPLSLSIAFATSPVEILNPETGDRRFMAISVDSKRAS